VDVTSRTEGGSVAGGELNGKRVAFVATHGVEQVELERPWAAVRGAGGQPLLLSIEGDEIQAMNHMDKGDRFDVEGVVGREPPDAFDALVLPGGALNPDHLRMEPTVVDFVRTFVRDGKPVAAICHAPWLLVEADVVADRTLTSYPSLRTDIENAGGRWVDEEVVVDHGLVTSRSPDDLDAFCRAMVEEIREGRHPRGTRARAS
jgi:protease I